MGLTPLAFSVHNFISSVGADAGFAAIIGLAILVLLYFAHARETANLREEAALLAARLQQAEARVAELSRPQAMAIPAPDAVEVTDQRGTTFPFAPAGVGAPALADATRVVPLPEPDRLDNAEPAEAEPAVAMAAAPVASASPPAAAPPSAAPASAGPPWATPGKGATTPQPAPAPASAPPAIPGPATAAGANGGGRGPASSLPAAALAGPGATASNGPAAGRPLPPLGPPASRGSSRAGRILMAVLALLLVGAIAVALIVLTSNNSHSSSSSSQARTTNAPGAGAAGFAPSRVTVAVLNGTATNQLAHRVAAKLAADGYREGRVATAANQTEATTVVAYLPGARNRTDALHVARTLHLRPTAVRAIDQGTEQVACPPPGSCSANVVVTVGADLATL
jgi:hypothetical protein